MIYSCCDDRRLAVLAQQSVYNGIRFLEVVDDPTEPMVDRQRTLLVHFVHPLVPGQLTPPNVAITGGERITNIQVLEAYDQSLLSPSGDPTVLVVVVSAAGDFSAYTLTLIDPAHPTQPPSLFDPVLSSIDFSFKAACPSDFDCNSAVVCPPIIPDNIDISYLAKDFSSFRALMLDRMAKIIPQWRESSLADLGIVLVEIAFVHRRLFQLPTRRRRDRSLSPALHVAAPPFAGMLASSAAQCTTAAMHPYLDPSRRARRHPRFYCLAYIPAIFQQAQLPHDSIRHGLSRLPVGAITKSSHFRNA